MYSMYRVMQFDKFELGIGQQFAVLLSQESKLT